VAFKQNLPILAVILALGAGVGVFLFLQPPPEDRLRKAVTAHAATIQDSRGFVLFGNVADIQLADGKVIHAEFVEKPGEWVFSKDLGEDFRKTVTDPSTMGQIMTRLAQRLAARWNTDVKVKEGTRYEHLLTRDDQGLLGQVAVLFAYPNDQKRGRYVEKWRYTDGRWSNVGVGSLYDLAPPR
jgi:hypothetical protein